MHLPRRFFQYCFLIIINYFIFSSPLQAEQQREAERHNIHYNVFNSSMLTPETANQYGIQRSLSQGVINVSVHDKTQKAVTAFIEGEAKNHLSQLNELTFRKVIEGKAIYYIATFNFIDKGMLTFNLNVVPQGEKKRTKISFSQQFFKE